MPFYVDLFLKGKFIYSVHIFISPNNESTNKNDIRNASSLYRTVASAGSLGHMHDSAPEVVPYHQ